MMTNSSSKQMPPCWGWGKYSVYRGEEMNYQLGFTLPSSEALKGTIQPLS